MPEGRSKNQAADDATACGAGWPTAEADIAAWTDVYFKRTRKAVERFGETRVTYAVFMRRPVISAPRLALDLIDPYVTGWTKTFDSHVAAAAEKGK